MVDNIVTILEVIGVTSIIGLIGLYLAFLGFLPEIVIEGVTDKTEFFNSESNLRIKNNGRIAARNIRADVHGLNIEFATNTFENCSFINCGPPIATKLSSGEQTETTIRPGIGLSSGQHFDEFSYTLELKYHARLLLFKKSFSKKWNVELNNYPDRYSWTVTVV